MDETKQFSYLWVTSFETNYQLTTTKELISDNLTLIAAIIALYALFTFFILPKKFSHSLQLNVVGNVHSAVIVLLGVPTTFRMCESVLNTYTSSWTVLDVLCNRNVDNVAAFWITLWSAFQLFIAMETVISYLSGHPYPVPLAIHHVYAIMYYPICLVDSSEYLRALILLAALIDSVTYSFTFLRHHKLVSRKLKMSINTMALAFELTTIFLLFSYGAYHYLLGDCLLSVTVVCLNAVIFSVNMILLGKYMIQLKQRLNTPEDVLKV
ncbi:hypothetical protein HDE_11647 [Halotydeus destructor]|nr:hypothetical protein HDE_11647 [Halotydeus destructor]